MNNNKDVVFHEGRELIHSPQFQISKKYPEESRDRVLKLIKKISGGYIKSEKTATYIVSILVIIMFAISIFLLI